MLNPYQAFDVEPSLYTEDNAFQEKLEDRVKLTKRLLFGFSAFAFTWPLLASTFTGAVYIDMWALLVAIFVWTTNSKTIRRFPIVVLFLLVYPIVFVINAYNVGFVGRANAILPRNSLILALGLITAIWAVCGIYSLLRCHLIARREKR